MWVTRIALSGLDVTPCGAMEMLYILGKDETLKRIEQAIKNLNGK
jgi:glutamyl-tRNA synthetase